MLYWYILYTLYRYRLESYTEYYGVDINISLVYTYIKYTICNICITYWDVYIYTIVFCITLSLYLYKVYNNRYRLESYTEGYGVDINISVCYTGTYCILYIGID
jgi:hypothetical protein